MSKKKIVIIGGGNGSALSINAAKQFKDEVEISAIVSMSDSGGSSGRLRNEFGTLPPGDIMRAVLAMSPYDYEMLKTIFHRQRFSGVGKLDNHNLGNLFLVLAEKYCGDYISAVRALEQAVEAVGTVYPVTLDKTDLVVELSNGDKIVGEDKIDRPDYDRNLLIKKAWLEPVGKATSESIKAIEDADFVILCSGSLYTSVIATLLPEGIYQALQKSQAKLIHTSGGAREKEGETGPRKTSEFICQLENYLPRKIDVIVYNEHKLIEKDKGTYEEKGWEKVEFDGENLKNYNISAVDFEKDGGGLDPEKLSIILKDVICK